MLTFPPPFRQQPCIYLVSTPKGITFKVMRSSLCQGEGKEVKGQGCFRLAGKGTFIFFIKNLVRGVSSLQFCKSRLLVNKMFSFFPSLPTTTVYGSIGLKSRQCAAVSTQLGLISEPPQEWNPPFLREIIHGQELEVALTPPITKPLKGRTPHPTWK